MLSSSLRRAAWAPIVPISGISQTLASSSNAVVGVTRHVHQRRYSSSSSKPPVPPSDGSRRIDTTPSKNVSPSGEKREGKAARRRAKDGNGRHGSSKSNQHAALANLPSVPSTQHVQPHDLHVASFFSIHRPISVTSTVPPTSSAEAFDAIFSSKKSTRTQPDDVIFTLSSTVNSMETAAHNMSEQEDLPNLLNRVSLNQMEAEANQLDMSDMKSSIEEYVRRLRPFHPPPAPVPFDEAQDAMNAEELLSQQTSTYSTVLTIRESTHADGRKTYEAHTTPFVRTDDMEAPSAFESEAIIDSTHSSGATYIERMRNNRTMHAISTRRRRIRKMKKHKFKKLLRKTRTLRRKLDKS